MTVRVAINGFGRIGRLALRAIIESKRKDILVVGINDLGSVEANAHLLRYDSVHGMPPFKVGVKNNTINVGRGDIMVTAERDPTKLPWKKLKVDLTMECTGLFTSREKSAKHLKSGARKVLVSAPTNNADLTVVYGVNDDKLNKKHRVVSNASCTTNCLAPVAYVLHQALGIEKGFMTTVHASTGDQRMVDTLHSDLQRARAASASLIPATTGAARAIGEVLPELAGKLDGYAIRVPTLNVSLVDLTFIAAKTTSVKEVNEIIKKASRSRRLKGILATTEQPMVSIDFNHNPCSSTVDLPQTQVIKGNFVRILSWYDNEWGFSNRMADVAAAMANIG
ncbi:MAG: type I glyceraldehyde-3-phosphate dehydrogenase [Rhodospirillales bacterium]